MSIIFICSHLQKVWLLKNGVSDYKVINKLIKKVLDTICLFLHHNSQAVTQTMILLNVTEIQMSLKYISNFQVHLNVQVF